jgi:hypothetical protein
MAQRQRNRPTTGTRGQVKAYPFGRICETKGCATRLSIYNDDTICAPCYEAIDITTLPVRVGKYV